MEKNMGYNFTKCDVCPTRFRVKKLNKPYIGMYKDKPVFHWYYDCPNSDCRKRHTVRFYNQFINTYYDKVMSLQFSLFLYRKDEEKCNQLLKEYEIANDELEKITNELKCQLVSIRKI
jgi:hypothetical protein